MLFRFCPNIFWSEKNNIGLKKTTSTRQDRLIVSFFLDISTHYACVKMRIPICVDTIFRPQRKLGAMNNNRYRRERVVLSLWSDKNNIPVNNRIIGIISLL